jgi:hypothetical protein
LFEENHPQKEKGQIASGSISPGELEAWSLVLVASYRWRLLRAFPTRQCLPVVAALRYASALHPLMARANKLLDQILRGDADANIPFSGMVQLLKRLGFRERIKASHHIFSRDGVAEILNLQPHSGKCKPYQVKQVRNVIINYRLAGEADA